MADMGAAGMGQAVKPQDTGYMSSADMVSQSEAAKPNTNPLIPAFETIMQFVVAAEQQGKPNAAAMKQHLQALMQEVVKSGPGGETGQPPAGQGAPKGMPPAPTPEMPPQEAPAAEGQPDAEMPPRVAGIDEEPEAAIPPAKQKAKQRNLNKSIQPMI